MTPEENKAIVYRFVQEGLNQRNSDLIKEVYSGDYVGHDPDLPQPRRIEDLRHEVISVLSQAFPDYYFTIESLIAEDDMVTWHWTFSATHHGELMGIPATGKAVAFGGVSIFRMANCRIVEDWVFRDTLGLLRQLGLTLAHILPFLSLTSSSL
jgi:steroid delta-isomerase-like uncharacterized protein